LNDQAAGRADRHTGRANTFTSLTHWHCSHNSVTCVSDFTCVSDVHIVQSAVVKLAQFISTADRTTVRRVCVCDGDE